MVSATKDRRLPLALPITTLIGCKLYTGGSKRPTLHYGHAGFTKCDKDYFLVKPDCLCIPDDPSSAFSVFVVFDGHNRVSAVIDNIGPMASTVGDGGHNVNGQRW